MKKFIILNLFSLVAVVGLGVLMLRETAQATATLRELTAVAAVERDATEIRAQMVTMSDALRGFLLDPSKQGEFDRKKAADAELSEAVDRLTTESADAEYVRLAGAIGQLDEDALDPLEDRVLELAPKNAANAVRVYFDEYLPVRVKQTGLVDELRTLASRRFHERATSAQASMQRASTVVTWAGGILGLLMVGAFAWSVRSTRAVERQLSSETTTMADTAHGVLRASRELSKAAQSLSQGATEQAASLEQTSASMEEMASVVRRNADHSKQAADLMHGVDASVRRSNACLDEMVTSMTAIQQSSQEVARIIKTIDEIAFQTNILALNAAVEAARAGDAGMGFAVVADEVRSLALRSAQAARDTAVLIEASLSRTTAGQAKVEQVAEAITSITASVTAVKGLVDQVSTATSEQADGISQVAQAVAQMERVTQTTAATAEESAASSEELNAQAESALLVVTRLEQLVGTRRADEPPPTRAEEPTMPRSLRPAA